MKLFGFGFVILLLSGCTGHTYRVTTESMSNTFNPGQILKLSKKTSIEKGEIVFFRNTRNSKGKDETWMFRVVASSGDILEIKDGNVFVNGSLMAMPEKARMLYGLTSTSPLNMQDFRENTIRQIGDSKYIAFLTSNEFSKISGLKNVISIERIIKTPGEQSSYIVRNNYSEAWNEDQLGPLRIPSPGEKIKITKANKGLYNDILSIMGSDSTILIKEKLYFLMGDNRYNAVDSRYIGFVTESNIIGSAEQEE